MSFHERFHCCCCGLCIQKNFFWYHERLQMMSNYLHFIFIKDLQQVLWNESVDAFHERLHLLLHAGHEAPLDHLSGNKHSRLLVTSLLSSAHLTCSHNRAWTRSLSFPNLTLTTEGQSFSFPNLTALTTGGQGHFHSQI